MPKLALVMLVRRRTRRRPERFDRDRQRRLWKGATLGSLEGGGQHVADIQGDWREEVVTFVRGELRVYGTTIPAADRRVCLMQDSLYRNDVTHRSMGYPHVPQTSYYLGVGSK